MQSKDSQQQLKASLPSLHPLKDVFCLSLWQLSRGQGVKCLVTGTLGHIQVSLGDSWPRTTDLPRELLETEFRFRPKLKA